MSREVDEHEHGGVEATGLSQSLVESQKLESLGLLAGTIAHDFKNVLAAILGNANLATAELATGRRPPRLHVTRLALHEIEDAAQRGADLCRQLLAYAGRSRFVVGRVDLGRLVRDNEGLLRMAVAARVPEDDGTEVRFEFCLAPGLPMILADATQIQQIVLNLVINSADAILTPGAKNGRRRGTIRVCTRAEELTAERLARAAVGPESPPGRYVCLRIADDGCGMTPETLRRIFEPFFTTKPTGRGLGLAVVIGAVRSHGGGIIAESVPGRGTSFLLFFPATDGGTTAPAPSPAPANVSYQGEVLVIDDDESVAGVIARMLEATGFRVSIAYEAADGLDLIRNRSGRFRCLFLDWTMQGLHGAEAFRRLREASPGIPTVLMSGYSEEEVLGSLGRADKIDFLAKPFRWDAVQAALRRVLGGEM